MNHVRRLLLFSGVIILSSCATTTNFDRLPAVSPGHLYKGEFVTIHAPNSEGWRLAGSSQKGMAFGKRGLAPGETLSAMVVIFPLEPTETPEQFVILIKNGIDKDTNPSRFSVVRSTTEYSGERPYPCVRHRAAVEDKEARTSPSTKEALLLETDALYCRHPVRSNTGFAAIYSYRGRHPYPPLADEARGFLDGVQVPSGAH